MQLRVETVRGLHGVRRSAANHDRRDAVPLTAKEEAEASKADLLRGLAIHGGDPAGWAEAVVSARADPAWGKPDETFGCDYCAICRSVLTSWIAPDGRPTHPYCHYNPERVAEARARIGR